MVYWGSPLESRVGAPAVYDTTYIWGSLLGSWVGGSPINVRYTICRSSLLGSLIILPSSPFQEVPTYGLLT